MRFLYSALCLIGVAVVQCVIISNSRFADSLPWSGYSESLPHPASSGDRAHSASHTQSIRTKHHQHESLAHSSRHFHSSKSHSSKYDDNNKTDDREYRKQEKKQKKKLKQEQKQKQKKQKQQKQKQQKQVADEAQAAEQPLPPSPSPSPRPRKPLYQPYELPNKRLSRGAVFVNATSNVVCTPGYIHQIANLTDAQQTDVLNRYGLPSIHQGYCSGEGGCKIDHVIPIEIGGSNDITNLWPQPYFGEWNAHLKDDLEMFLYKGICNGTINQRHAQKEIRKNWIKAYRKYLVVKGNTTTIATKWHTNYYDDDDDDDDVEQEKKENEKEEEEKKKKKKKSKKSKKNKKKENKKDKDDDDDDDDDEEDDDDKEEEDDDDGDAHKTKPKDKNDDDLDEDEDEDDYDEDDDDDDFLHHHGPAPGNNSNQSANSTSNSSGTATPIIDTTGIDKYLTPASDSSTPSVTGEPSSSSSSSLEAPPDHTLPNKQYTTGAVFPDANPSVICVPGYTKKVRNVTEAEKKKVYAEYGLPGNNQGFCKGAQGCEIDHLIPLEIGGSNDITNLWPQPYFGDWNAHIKDALENHLKKGICDNTIDQKQAQKDIASNWQTAYNKYMKGL